MGLAITIGVIVALIIGLLLWCRGAIAASERRHQQQVERNARVAELHARMRNKSDAATERKRVVAAAYSRPSGAAPSTSRIRSTSSSSSSRYDSYTPSYSPPSYDYGGSSDYSGGGSSSCSSDGGGGGGGCD